MNSTHFPLCMHFPTGQVYHNFLKLVNYGLVDVQYKCPEKDGFEPSESPWPNGLNGGHARWQSIVRNL